MWGADTEIGRLSALVLGARGARVVVAGQRERALAEVVGEIASAGGKARHVAAGAGELARALERAAEAFGGIDLVVAAADDAAALGAVLRAAAERAGSRGPLVGVGPAAAGETVRALAPRSCCLVAPSAAAPPEAAAELAVLLATGRCPALSGRVVALP